MRNKQALDTKPQTALVAARLKPSLDEKAVGELRATAGSSADRDALKAIGAANGARFEAGAKAQFEKWVASMPMAGFGWCEVLGGYHQATLTDAP